MSYNLVNKSPRSHSNIKMLPCHYRKSHFGGKTILSEVIRVRCDYFGEQNNEEHGFTVFICLRQESIWKWVNSLSPSDVIWWQIHGSTLAHVMAWCLMEPSHYLNQCWLIISKVMWHSPEATPHKTWYVLCGVAWGQFHRKCMCKISSLIWVWKSLIQDYRHILRGQRVNLHQRKSWVRWILGATIS